MRPSSPTLAHAETSQAFLSKEMQYSCPIWSENEGGVCGDLQGHRAIGDLEAAQVTKIDYIIRKARLRSGGRLLEIGSGWGSVAIAVSPFLSVPLEKYMELAIGRQTGMYR